MKKRSPLQGKFGAGLTSVLSSLMCIIIGLAVGFIILLIMKPSVAYKDGFKKMILSGFLLVKTSGKWSDVGKVIIETTPLILTGLSVAFAFKTGLFNIGAAGQYTLGAFGALYFALVLKMPWYVCLLAAAAFGAVWGAIPGIFKAFLNINEVITAIMFNWVGLYLVNFITYGGGKGVMYNAKTTQTYPIGMKNPDGLLPSKIFGWDMQNTFDKSAVSIGIFIALIVVVIVYIVLNKTVFGYELKACGHNKNAAKYAGINEKRNIVLSMVIAGALAGLGAGLMYLGNSTRWEPQISTALPSQGFDGISVALLGSLNPFGCIFSAAFIAHLTEGGAKMKQSIFPLEVAGLITGAVVYLCAFSGLFKGFAAKLLNKLFGGKNEMADANKE